MEIKTFAIHHLVKGEDLNHHGTLYAGRSAEWFVESGFIAAASLTHPESIVCLKIHGMTFSRPVRKGEIVRFDSKIVLAGKSRLVAFIAMMASEQLVVRGFVTFINVDENGRALPHGITITATSPEDTLLQEEAAELK